MYIKSRSTIELKAVRTVDRRRHYCSQMAQGRAHVEEPVAGGALKLLAADGPMDRQFVRLALVLPADVEPIVLGLL
jgi:hypothetical protein